MKKKRNVVLLLLTVIFFWGLQAFVSKEKSTPSEDWYVDSELHYKVLTLEDAKENLNVENTLQLGKSYVGFKEALAFKESQGIYDIVSRYGYIGKYQFALNSLNAIGVTDIEDFRQNSKLQEEAFLAYTARNKWLLRNYITKYEGEIINGIEVTESGVLAAAHLAGAGNVKKYLRTKGSHQVNDAFGTTLQFYLKLFSGYDTSFIPADRNAIVSI